MLAETLRKAWRAQKTTFQMDATMAFRDHGLVLGAGVVLAPAETGAEGRSLSLEGQEIRLLALLSAAHGRLVGTEVLDHIRRGAQRWCEGDESLAAIHLALTPLGKLAEPKAAQRLFLADLLMEAGTKPEMIPVALGLGAPNWGSALKFYNPDQPRVAAGNGRVSGQWTRGGGLLLRNLSRVAVEGLARLAVRFSAPAVFLGVLFIPTNKTTPEEEHDVPGHPGLRYERLIGDRLWRIAYDGDDGEEHTILQETNGALRDPQGHIVGRVLPDGHVAIELAAVAPKHLQDDEPRYCPAPSPDKFGQGMGSIARDYEDQVKRFVNPEAPTPRGLAVALTNPMNHDAIVTFDDCQHSTGDMIEAKGPTFPRILQQYEKYKFEPGPILPLLKQSLSQIEAAGPRRVRCFFADKEAADYVRRLFQERDQGREHIEVEVLSYVGRQK